MDCLLNQKQQYALGEYLSIYIKSNNYISLTDFWLSIYDVLNQKHNIIQYAMITPKFLGRAYFHSNEFEQKLESSGLAIKYISELRSSFKDFNKVIEAMYSHNILERPKGRESKRHDLILALTDLLDEGIAKESWITDLAFSQYQNSNFYSFDIVELESSSTFEMLQEIEKISEILFNRSQEFSHNFPLLEIPQSEFDRIVNTHGHHLIVSLRLIESNAIFFNCPFLILPNLIKVGNEIQKYQGIVIRRLGRKIRGELNVLLGNLNLDINIVERFQERLKFLQPHISSLHEYMRKYSVDNFGRGFGINPYLMNENELPNIPQFYQFWFVSPMESGSNSQQITLPIGVENFLVKYQEHFYKIVDDLFQYSLISVGASKIK